MNTTPRFDKALDSLYKAFFEGTLAKWNCACCAVGNIVAESKNMRITPEEFKKLVKNDSIEYVCHNEKIIENSWFSKFGSAYGRNQAHETKWLETVNETGYTGQELWKIETAFENNTKIQIHDYCRSSEQDILNDQYNGLVAVFKVLCELDNIPYEGFEEKLKKHPKLEKCLN